MGSTSFSNLFDGCSASFVINGTHYSDLPVITTLNTFIRENAKLKGTKYMCLEGGCGACIVAVTLPDPVSGKNKTFAVNSCLVPIYLCHGWSVTTIEHLGSRYNGYDSIQTRLAGKNGSQCGYCTPGMVMNMYSKPVTRMEL